MKKFLFTLLALFAFAAHAEQSIVRLTKDASLIAEGTEAIVYTNKGKLHFNTNEGPGEYFVNAQNPTAKGTCLYLSTESEGAIDYNKRVDKSNVRVVKKTACPGTKVAPKPVDDLMGQCMAAKNITNGFMVYNSEQATRGVHIPYGMSGMVIEQVPGRILLEQTRGWDIQPNPNAGKPLGWVSTNDFYPVALRNCM